MTTVGSLGKKVFLGCQRIRLSLFFVAFIAFSNFAFASVAGGSAELAMPGVASSIKFKNFNSKELAHIGSIWSISQDSNGYMWFGGSRGAIRFDGINYKLYRHNPESDGSIPSGIISDILSTSDGKLWFATHNGLHLYKPNTDSFEIQLLPPFVEVIWDLVEHENGCLLMAYIGQSVGSYCPNTGSFEEFKINLDRDGENEQFYAVLKSTDGHIWTGSNKGLYQINTHTGKSRNFGEIEPITKIKEDRFGNIWIGTVDGLYRYQSKIKELYKYENQEVDPNGVGSDSVGDIVIDKNFELWVILDGGGLSLFNYEEGKFFQISSSRSKPGRLKNNSLRRGFITNTNELWIGHHPYGVAVSNRYSSLISSFVNEPENENSISNSTIHSVSGGFDGVLWAATESGLNRIDLNKNKVSRLSEMFPQQKQTLEAPVLSVLVDSKNRVWAGTWGKGLYMFNNTLDEFKHYTKSSHKNSIYSDAVFSIVELDNRHLLLGSGNIIEVLDLSIEEFKVVSGFDQGVEKIINIDDKYALVKGYHSVYLFDKSSFKLLSSDLYEGFSEKIFDVHKDEKDVLWFLTENGVYRQNHVFSPLSLVYNRASISNFYGQILTDQNSDLWLGGTAGVTVLDDSGMSTFNEHFGIPQGSYTAPRASLLLPDGRLVFGGTDGLLVLNPEIKTYGAGRGKVIFTGLKVHGVEVTDYLSDSPLAKPINLAERIDLDHSKNVFSISYTTLDFQNPENASYLIRLHGFEDEWRNVGHQRSATYTNIKPGAYTFQVRSSSDSEGKVSSIKVFISPPWWKSTEAYVLYALLVIVFLLLIGITISTYLLKEKERRINSQLVKLDKAKDEFLAYTSHELRAPLNGIIGIIDSLLTKSDIDIGGNVDGKLKIVSGSSRRLLYIINDILDFLKSKEHEISLKRDRIDLSALSNEVLSVFKVLATNKPISFENHISANFISFIADQQRLTQILYNLVGNALKFTEKGAISISATHENDLIKISVEDTGCGIPDEDIARIFEPFDQATNQECASSVGSGIGLSITKKMVQLHGGSITASSVVGQGSAFQFTLKYISPSQEFIESDWADSDTTIRSKKSNLKAIIIDDDAVNRLVVSTFLKSEKVETFEACSADSAFKLFESKSIDIAILDLFIPGVSGLKICETLRNQYPAKELAIIFLTGSSDDELTARCLAEGANKVLIKPVTRNNLIKAINESMGEFE